MGNIRPICDFWLLGRPKVPYYGAYPNGFLERARVLLGAHIDEPVLHVCGGKARDYPGWGFGRGDYTLDLDRKLDPDFFYDAEGPWPTVPMDLAGAIADPPYTPTDARKYAPGEQRFPKPRAILGTALHHVRPGGRVGMLHYICPRPPAQVDDCEIRFVAAASVLVGFDNRVRIFSVFEKREPKKEARR